jgi:hypothetical protein
MPSSRYDNPICRTGSPGYIGWRNRFLGIDSIPKRLQIQAQEDSFHYLQLVKTFLKVVVACRCCCYCYCYYFSLPSACEDAFKSRRCLLQVLLPDGGPAGFPGCRSGEAMSHISGKYSLYCLFNTNLYRASCFLSV